jgi:hypothetical protein
VSTTSSEEVLRKIHEATALIVDLDDDPGSGGEHHDDFVRCMQLIDGVLWGGDLSEVDGEVTELLEKWKENHSSPEEVIEERG